MKKNAIISGIVAWLLTVIVFQVLFEKQYISLSVFFGFLTYSMVLNRQKSNHEKKNIF